MRGVGSTLAAIALLTLTACRATGQGASGAPAESSPTVLTVSVAGTALAGTSVPVTVSGANGTAVSLVAVGSLGTSTFSQTASGGIALFRLPSSFTRASGTVTLLASTATSTSRATLDLLPGTAVAPVQAVVGARSIVADGTDRSMVVTIPADGFGNAIADGSTVRVSRESPSGVQSATSVHMQHLLAWQLLTSGTLAGRGYVWISAGTATGPAVSLDEVAAPPAPFTLSAVDPALAGRTGADGQTLVQLRTSVLADRHGNVEPDGTLVTVEWLGPQGSSRTEAVSVAGVARLSIQAPDSPETLTLSGLCRGSTTAHPTKLAFASVVAPFRISAVRAAVELTVTVGPVTRIGGSFVPDGSIATAVVTDRFGHREAVQGELVDGSVALSIPSSSLTGPLVVTATVLGASRTTAVG